MAQEFFPFFTKVVWESMHEWTHVEGRGKLIELRSLNYKATEFYVPIKGP